MKFGRNRRNIFASRKQVKVRSYFADYNNAIKGVIQMTGSALLLIHKRTNSIDADSVTRLETHLKFPDILCIFRLKAF